MGGGVAAERKRGELLMADYLTTDTELTSVADAIRTKGGTSALLEWPDGFVDAIDAISGGGGGSSHTVTCNAKCQVLTASGASIDSTGTWSALGGSATFAAGDVVVARVPNVSTLKNGDFTATPSVQGLELYAYSSNTTGYAVFVMPDNDVALAAS